MFWEWLLILCRVYFGELNLKKENKNKHEFFCLFIVIRMKWDVYLVFVCDYVLRSTWSAARMTGFVSLRIGWENWNDSLTRWTGLTSGADNESTIASQGWRDAIDIQAQRNSDSALKTGCWLCRAVNETFEQL